MSLVVASNCDGCQYWCGDRILVDTRVEPFAVVSIDYQKIRRIPGVQVLVGLSGSSYDTDLIWEGIIAAGPVNSVGNLLSVCSSVVREVNNCSFAFGASHSLPIYHTGLIVGGYIDAQRFLSVVQPGGDVLAMSVFAAIGVGINKSDCQALRQKADCEKFDITKGIIDECFSSYLEGIDCQNTVLDRYLVTPTGIIRRDF